MSFYLSWFSRCFVCGEAGWTFSQTPDGRAIMFQDAYFWRCLEIICSTMNTVYVEQRRAATKS